MNIMYRVPAIAIGIPTQANSKKPKGLKPASTKALEAIRFGGVPIIVKMPPKAMPNASGSSCLEAGSLAAEQMPSTTGIRQAVVPVLDKKPDRTAPMIMIPSIRLFSLVPNTETTFFPMFCASPVWNIAAPTTNMPANRSTEELERPEKTALGVMKPNRPQATAPPIDVTASGISSVMKSKAITASSNKNCTSGVMIINSFSPENNSLAEAGNRQYSRTIYG